jgi:DNA-binding transcriptional ArsR family regulator
MRHRQPGFVAVAVALAALADPVRLRILRLVRQRELCVCEFVDALRIPQYRVSRHLTALRRLGLVAARREGRWMHYRRGPALGDGGVLAEVVGALTRHLSRLDEARGDDAGLMRRLALRQAGRCVVGTPAAVRPIQCAPFTRGRARGKERRHG